MARLCLLAVAFALETRHSVSLRGKDVFDVASEVKALGLPISTCGGSADAGSTEQVQMEQQHGKPCKFPFVYKGVEYNECTEVDSGGVGAWCRTQFPDKGDDPDGPIRWAVCNPEGKECPSNPFDAGKSAAASSAIQRVEAQLLLLERFFQWTYWKPIILCALTLLFFSEVVGPVMDAKVGGFYSNGMVFVLQMLAFFLVAAVFNDPSANASQHILALSTVMLILGALVALSLLVVACRTGKGKSDWMMSLIDDFSEVLRPLSRAVVVFLLIYGTLEDIDAKWATIAGIGGLFVFGIAIATTSLVQDLMAYVFIRGNNWFTENDLIYYNGGLLQVLDIHWRYTQALQFSNKCTIYVPNGRLGNAELVNQSQDFGRMVVKNIPLPPQLNGEALEAIVKAIWALLKGYEGKTFTGLDGTQYDNQLDTESSGVFISDNAAAASAKELSQVTLTVKMKGKYSYSTPPPFAGEGDEPDWRDRQWDWLGPWNSQQERILIDVQKVLDKHTTAVGK